MDELISRQAAIDAILHNQELYSNNFGSDPIDRYTIAIIDNDAQTIAQLPSAQPEQKWIPCEEVVPWAFLERYADWFCGSCSHAEFVRMAKLFWERENGEREETEDGNN